MKNKKNPLVSVLMPNYNCEKYINEAIESILKQTYKNFEFIIIDDSSTDNSWEIIKKYSKKDKRIKCFRNEKNLQIVKTRNKLFEKVSKNSKYLAIMDSDDISHKDRLKKQVHFLEKKENKNVGVVGTNLIFINENSKEIGKREYKKEITKKDILIKSPIAQPSCMIRKEVIKKVGNYKKDKYDVAKDFDLWVRVFEFFEIKNIQENLIKYRVFKNQVKSKQLKNTLKSTIKTQVQNLNKYLSFKLTFIILAEIILLFLPNRFVLWLFKVKEFKINNLPLYLNVL